MKRSDLNCAGERIPVMSARSKPSMRNSASGFTLVELAVTLTIFAILTGAVAPMAGTWVANLQIRSTAEAVQNGLIRARMEALRRNRNVQFSLVALSNPAMLDNSCTLAANASSWVISVNDPTGKCGDAPSATVDPMNVEGLASGALAQRVTVSALQSDGATPASSVTFDGFGRVNGGGAIATVDVDNSASGNDFRRLRVQVASGGSIRMCDPLVTDSTDVRFC